MIHARLIIPGERLEVKGESMVQLWIAASERLGYSYKDVDWDLKYGVYYLTTREKAALVPLDGQEFPNVTYQRLPLFNNGRNIMRNWLREELEPKEVQLMLW